jgi:hypothetical protein
MKGPRTVIAVGLALVVLVAIVVGSIALAGGGDDEANKETSPPASEAPLGDGGGSPAPPSPSALPPELLQCFADKGYAIESPAEIHSAPPEVVQECFGALHQGGGAP